MKKTFLLKLLISLNIFWCEHSKADGRHFQRSSNSYDSSSQSETSSSSSKSSSSQAPSSSWDLSDSPQYPQPVYRDLTNPRDKMPTNENVPQNRQQLDPYDRQNDFGMKNLLRGYLSQSDDPYNNGAKNRLESMVLAAKSVSIALLGYYDQKTDYKYFSAILRESTRASATIRNSRSHTPEAIAAAKRVLDCLSVSEPLVVELSTAKRLTDLIQNWYNITSDLSHEIGYKGRRATCPAK